jgi:cellulose synthase/poly-beta-1,6-N-acetylglucosamine synthase-like glycosyltransferase
VNWPYLVLVPVIAVYLLMMIALTVYVLNYLYLALVGLKYRRGLRPAALTDPVPWPRVTVQLPIYNELYVAARLISAAAALDYPRESLEIQILDDSTDETTALVAAEVARHRARGIDMAHLHRASRRGFKAGALSDGLAVAKGEFVAIFDADFLPASDFLRRMLPRFDHERVAFVQARW